MLLLLNLNSQATQKHYTKTAHQALIGPKLSPNFGKSVHTPVHSPPQNPESRYLSPFTSSLLRLLPFTTFTSSFPSSLHSSSLPPLHTDNTSSTDGTNNDSELWKRAKLLAHRVQSVCITEHLPTGPKRVVVITSVIHTLLVSLMDGVKQCDRFLKSDLSLEPDGLK